MNKLVAVCLLCSLPVGVLFASERGDRSRGESTGWLYGFGVLGSAQIYKGYDSRITPVPVVGYRGEKLSVLGPFVLYDVYEKKNFAFTLTASPRFQGYESSDSDVFLGMDERQSSIDMGARVKYSINNWLVDVSVRGDVLGRSDGVEVKTGLGRKFNKGPFFFQPNISVSVLDSNHVDYYYGVKANEVVAGRPAYDGSSVVNTSIGLGFSTPVLLGGFTRITVDSTWFGEAITDSPLVDDKQSLGARMFFTRYF